MVGGIKAMMVLWPWQDHIDDFGNWFSFF